MITALARFEMIKGKEDEALAALTKMAGAVKANEPGAVVYAVTRGQVNPLEVYVYEVYKDRESFDAHRKTEHMRQMQSAFDGSLSRASFNIEILEEAAGFVRPEAVH